MKFNFRNLMTRGHWKEIKLFGRIYTPTNTTACHQDEVRVIQEELVKEKNSFVI
jgi:hypothetical protein